MLHIRLCIYLVYIYIYLISYTHLYMYIYVYVGVDTFYKGSSKAVTRSCKDWAISLS